MKQVLQYIVFLAIGIGLIWYSVATGIINPTKLWADVSNARLGWVLSMVALMFVAHGSRAARWKMLLEPLGYHPSFVQINNAVWLGYFANNLVPRLGEVTRCSQLYKSDKIPIEKSLGTVVVDRLFDVVALFTLLLLHLIIDFDRLWQFVSIQLAQRSATQNQTPWGLIVAFGILVVLGSLGIVFRQKLLQFSVINAIFQKVKGLIDGLLSIRQLKNPLLFIVYTIMIWGTYWLMGYVLFFAIPKFADLPMMASFTVLVSGALAMILPSPGGAGAVTAIVSPILVSMYGLNKDDAGTLSTFIQSSQMLATLLVGTCIFLISLFIKQK